MSSTSQRYPSRNQGSEDLESSWHKEMRKNTNARKEENLWKFTRPIVTPRKHSERKPQDHTTCVPLRNSLTTPGSKAWSDSSGNWQRTAGALSFLHNNFYLSFNLFCSIFSTLSLPSAVPDRETYGNLELLVRS